MTLVIGEVEQTAQATSSMKSMYVSSVLATAFVFFLGVGIPSWIAFGPAWGVGLGAMCAFWGGLGFGVMVGGARVSLKEDHEHPHDS